MMNELITIHTRFQHRRATAARWAEVNPILREGELGIELDTRRMKFGDGVTRWNSLEYCSKEILPASATELGGIKAEGKTDGYSVEVRIDPNTQIIRARLSPNSKTRSRSNQQRLQRPQ